MAGKKEALALIFGGKSKPSEMDDEDKLDGGADEAEEGDDMPPDFTAAYSEYEKDPSPDTFWRAVKACKG